jgi:hypothetical protein
MKAGTMQKRHFELIARILADARITSPDAIEAIDAIAWQFADALRSTNPRFDSARFARACGVAVESVGKTTDPRD